MRSVLKSKTVQNSIQELRVSVDIRKVVNNQYRKSNKQDYLRGEREDNVSRIKKSINVDEYTGATSRRTQYQQYYQDQPSLGFVYPMNVGKGMFMEPDCRFTGNEFMEKINTQFTAALTTSYSDIDKIVKLQANQNKEVIKQNLEKIFRENHPNKEFDFDREYARYLKLDSKKFKKEYGYDSD